MIKRYLNRWFGWYLCFFFEHPEIAAWCSEVVSVRCWRCGTNRYILPSDYWTYGWPPHRKAK